MIKDSSLLLLPVGNHSDLLYPCCSETFIDYTTWHSPSNKKAVLQPANRAMTIATSLRVAKLQKPGFWASTILAHCVRVRCGV